LSPIYSLRCNLYPACTLQAPKVVDIIKHPPGCAAWSQSTGTL